jgi:hypothetical protein
MTNALVVDGLYGNNNGHVQDIGKNNGPMGKRTLARKSGESDLQAVSEMD